MARNKDDLVKNILELSEKIFSTIPVVIPPEWFSSDITVAQLRILLFLHMQGPSRMSMIASGLEIALPTATGIVDNLVRKELVVRQVDPGDRRAVICALSPTGQSFINKIWLSGQAEMERLLDGLTLEQLEKTEEIAGFLYQNAVKQASREKGEVA